MAGSAKRPPNLNNADTLRQAADKLRATVDAGSSAARSARRCVVRVLIEMLQPCERRVHDPCCGSGVSICPLLMNAVSE